MGPLWIGLSLLCAAPLFTQEKDAPAAWLTLPDDPMGRLWASVDDQVVPWTPPAAADAPGPAGANGEAWETWARAITTLTPSSNGSPFFEPSRASRREATAMLIRFALDDRRAEDAFRWLRGLGADDPEALAGLLPRLFPGVPANTSLEPGGRIPPLPAGVVLHPQLPPEPRAAAERGRARRSTCLGLRIGGATLDLVLKLDGSGVVAEFIHRGGPAVSLVVLLPAPEGTRLKSLYVDWDLQTPPDGFDESTVDWSVTPIRITIEPQKTGEDSPGYTESFSIFARLGHVSGGIPRTPAPPLPTALAEGGLDLIVEATAPEAALADPWEAIAAAWQSAAELPVHVVAAAQSHASATGPALRGTAVRFADAPDPKLLRRQITSAIEERRRQLHLLYR